MANNRFIVDLQEGATPEQTNQILLQQFIRLASQLNQAKIPIIKGPNDELPEGIEVGQPIIDWSSGTSILKTFDGTNLI